MSKSEQIRDVHAPEFLKRSMQIYGRSTIEERAIPTVMDGLVPVQRRLIASAIDVKARNNVKFKKCAEIIGKCLGVYHPHGDVSAYGALVNMVWERYPLFERHGNFGSLTGAPPAAYRYTECRLSELGEDCIKNIDVVPAIPNYNSESTEPIFIPAPVPLLLCNGSSGIAVGVAQNIPPHNLDEIVSATKFFIENEKKMESKKGRKKLLSGLMSRIKGPDYIQGGILTSTPEELRALYRVGKGTLRYRCEYHFEKGDGFTKLVITSLCPGFSAENFVARMKDHKVSGVIQYVASETDQEKGLRIVVGFTNPAVFNDVLKKELNGIVSYNFYGLVTEWDDEKKKENKEFFHFNLLILLQSWVSHRKDFDRRVLERERAQVKLELERCHARLACTRNLDKVVAVFKNPKYDKPEIVQALIKLLDISEHAAVYITELKLIQVRRFSEKEQLENIQKLNDRLKEIESDLKNLSGVVIRHLAEIRKKYKDDRLVKLSVDSKEVKLKGKKQDKWFVIAPDGGVKVSDNEPIKKSLYPKRKTATPETALVTVGSETALFVTSDGKALEFPSWSLQDSNLDGIGDATVIGVIGDPSKVVAVTSIGTWTAFESPGKSKYKAINFNEGQTIAAVNLYEGQKVVVIGNKQVWWASDSDLEIRRPGVHGKRMSGLTDQISQVLVVGDGVSLYDKLGNQVSIKGDPLKASEVKLNKPMFAISEDLNIVMTKDLDVKKMDRREVVGLLKKNAILKCWAF